MPGISDPRLQISDWDHSRQGQYANNNGTGNLKSIISILKSVIMKSLPNSASCIFQAALLCLAVFALLGAGDDGARFNSLGHRLMCVCGCNQILLECNHVGCTYSDRMRNELMAGLDRGENDDLTLQGFVQKYGPTVLAAPTATGFNRVAWIMPFLALVLGLLTTIFIVLAWRKRPALAAPGGVFPVSGSELERFRNQARKDTQT
jgi:cytochrome c-type biogenesis protein CcmH